jgi:enoyl-CoA hydratase/carnithine racemase
MSDPRVIPAQDGAIGTMTLQHPKANSYDLAFMEDLDEAVEQMTGNDEIKVVVMRSGLEKFFSAGADIKAFQANTPAGNMKMIRFAHETLRKMRKSPKIFIAAINGHALGGGFEMALACDLRFAAEGEYRLGLPEVTLGLLPGNGGTQRLPRLIGRTRALEMMITGSVVPPAKALELGMVNRLYPAGELMEKTMAFARKLASGATLAIGHIKRAILEGSEMPLEEAMALEIALMAPLYESQDAAEGFAAFAEKRPATFTGR